MKSEIGLIGYGRFGKLAARKLKKYFKVCVFDPQPFRAYEDGIEQVTLEKAAGKELVILAVPINQMPSVLKAIAPSVRPNSLICDVCSVKEQPIQWMKDILPQHVNILGTHPLFGPDSATVSLSGKIIFFCPVRIKRDMLEDVKAGLLQQSLVVHEVTPTEHDLLMAKTLFVTQLVGRTFVNLDLPNTIYSTQTYKHLREIVQVSGNDSEELFLDMYHYNRYAKKVFQKYLLDSRKLSLLLEPMGS
ncbi:MAG: prephenate dehydrogenase [Bacteroidetes bacterium]|nr:MAG: prephenate dehydrogenase [Bacteroidota bacterium]